MYMYMYIYIVCMYVHAHTVVESALQLVSVTKEVRGDPCNQEGGWHVGESAECLEAGLRELRELAEDSHSESGLLAGETNKQ